MTRPKKAPQAPAPASAPPVMAPTKTSHLFGAKKSDGRSAITHERLAADIEAFRKAGGKIEVLGVTQALRRIDPVGGSAHAAPAPVPAPAPPKRRR